jgi:hypothetical protein
LVSLAAHDWVVLDRVLCCYPDLDRLLGNSVAAAKERHVFSVPASSGWRGLANRSWIRLEDATEALRGRPCRGYVHDIRRIEARLMDAGVRRTWPGDFAANDEFSPGPSTEPLLGRIDRELD